MTEQSAEAGAVTEPTVAAEQQPDSSQKPTETVDFWKQKAREQEQRAKANAKAADELNALKQAQMSETERTVARLAEMERETAAARAEALRFRIATRYGISDEDAELFLTATDEDVLERQAKALQERSSAVQQASQTVAGPRPDLSQGARDGALALNDDGLTDKLARAVGARR